MSEQKILEFRERAERLVTPADPGLLQRRGHTVRRRRQFAPVLALAVCGAIGIGIATYPADGRDAAGNIQPAAPTPVTGPTSIDSFPNQMPPGTCTLDQVPQDGRTDLTVELVGQNWIGWTGGAQKHNRHGASAGASRSTTTPSSTRATRPARDDLAGAIRQLSEIPGRVTQAARPDTALGLTGTHQQLSIPVDVICREGEYVGGYRTAVWPGPPDPRVTVDVWLLLQDGDQLLILTWGVRGNPPAGMRDSLDRTIDTLRVIPAPWVAPAPASATP
jgi:hypothetical protein